MSSRSISLQSKSQVKLVEAYESPLGPIKVVLHSTNIEDVIEWLVSDAE